MRLWSGKIPKSYSDIGVCSSDMLPILIKKDQTAVPEVDEAVVGATYIGLILAGCTAFEEELPVVEVEVDGEPALLTLVTPVGTIPVDDELPT